MTGFGSNHYGYVPSPGGSTKAQIESDSDSSSDSEDDQNVMVRGDPIPAWKQVGDGEEGYHRVVPSHFTADSDDLFMRSMLTKYALEATTCEDEDKKENCKPNGTFLMGEAQTRRAAAEVLATHKGLTGDALKTYLDTYFAKAWSHFDVNRTGLVEVIKMPQFMRFLASDQRMQLGESL